MCFTYAVRTVKNNKGIAVGEIYIMVKMAEKSRYTYSVQCGRQNML